MTTLTKIQLEHQQEHLLETGPNANRSHSLIKAIDVVYIFTELTCRYMQVLE